MILAGQQSTWPKLLFIENRMKVERLIEEGLKLGKPPDPATNRSPEDDLLGTTKKSLSQKSHNGPVDVARPVSRRSSVLAELKRQSEIFFDDPIVEGDDTGDSEVEEAIANDEDSDIKERFSES